MHHPAMTRRSRLPAFLLVLVALTGCQNQEFGTAAGDTLVWQSLEGHWVLVNYWAEWCKPCLEEIPELNALDQQDDFTVLGVNYDGVQGAELRDLGARMGIRYTMLTEDPAQTFGWKVPVALPATFVVNPNGELVETRFGPQTETELRELTSG